MSDQVSKKSIENTLNAMDQARLRNKEVFLEEQAANSLKTENIQQESEDADVDAGIKTEDSKVKPHENISGTGYVKRFLMVVAGAWMGIHILLGYLQRDLIYLGDKRPAGNPERYGFDIGNVEEITLTPQAGEGIRLAGWHVLPKGMTQEMWKRQEREFNSVSEEGERFLNETAIIYFPGNAGHRGYRSETLMDLASLKTHVFIFDYRGYSDSTGSPSEKALVSDARQIYEYVVGMNFDPRRIILFGESLGGGVSTQLASELGKGDKALGGLIIQSSFDSLENVAQKRYWFLAVRWLLQDKYLSYKYIPDIKCALLSIHGEQDHVISMELGKNLFAAAPVKSSTGIIKEFYAVPLCDHNDVRETGGNELKMKLGEFVRKVENAVK